MLVRVRSRAMSMIFENRKREAVPVRNNKTTTLPPAKVQRNNQLAFTNRYSEAFDVVYTNLVNQGTDKTSAKMFSPLAAQPPGTGKTVLGRNIATVLRRPRATEVQVDVARRLQSAWSLRTTSQGYIVAAMADTREENLVMRTLMACFPKQVDKLLKLKASTPIVAVMKDLPSHGLGFINFDDALGFLIFSSATGNESPNAYASSFKSGKHVRGCIGVVERLIEEGGPLLLVLDDITDLDLPFFNGYFETVAKPTPLQRAMSILSVMLQRLHAIDGCFVYCTGRSLWLSTCALSGASSPLFVSHILLNSLTAGDVLESLCLTTTEPGGRRLADDIGVAPRMLPYLAERAVFVTGGVGRVLQFALRAMQAMAAGRDVADSPVAVDAALEAVRQQLVNTKELFLRINWDGPNAAAKAGEVPQSLAGDAPKLRLQRLIVMNLLLDAPFDPSLEVDVGTPPMVKFTDALNTLGLSYAPMPVAGDASAVPAAPLLGSNGVASRSVCNLRVVAGDWLRRKLVEDMHLAQNPCLLMSGHFLDVMREFGGTMKGRPFETMCMRALCLRSLFLPGSRMRELLPHLGQSALGDVEVPRLSVVALPKVMPGATVLDEHARSELRKLKQASLESSEPLQWTGPATVSLADMAWILSEWMLAGTVGVPSDGQSGSSDFFCSFGSLASTLSAASLPTKLNKLGAAIKCANPDNGTDWEDLRDELAKAPRLDAPYHYTLVLWSTHLAHELQTAIGGSASSCVFGSGRWSLRKGKLVLAPRATQKAKFVVPAHMDLVIVNPAAPGGGGLAELLGSRLLADLRSSLADLTDRRRKGT